MRFAILGSHTDGLEMACALVASGRHQLLACTTPLPDAYRSRLGEPKRVADLEEVLADPAIDAVLVAGSPVNRPTQLRRALQSERPVLCVHPADSSPDTGYEAAMIQQDTGRVLLPLLPDALHPGVGRLAELIGQGNAGPLGELRHVEMERGSPEAALLDADGAGRKPALPGWDVLRRLGGEIAEVNSFAEREQLTVDEPVSVSGRFARGGMFQASFRPRQPEARWRLAVAGSRGRAELSLPHGPNGPAVLTWGESGTGHEEAWESWAPWPALVVAFEALVAGTVGGGLSWQDEVRCLELDDATRRSVERRRATTLEYPEPSEEAGFKGTMTLIGCGLLWLVLFMLILSVWIPPLGWLIAPALFVFLSLQVFLWVARRK
jgi:predicted dehydrogenase